MANKDGPGIVYIRLTEDEKALLESVRKAVGVSQNAYARAAIVAAIQADALAYADVIERQRELARHGN